jgi:hypothetical protein
LEEACAELEASRSQLATHRSQDAMLSGPLTPSATPTRKVFEYGDGGSAQEKISKENCQLEAGLEEAKVFAYFYFYNIQNAFLILKCPQFMFLILKCSNIHVLLLKKQNSSVNCLKFVFANSRLSTLLVSRQPSWTRQSLPILSRFWSPRETIYEVKCSY